MRPPPFEGGKNGFAGGAERFERKWLPRLRLNRRDEHAARTGERGGSCDAERTPIHGRISSYCCCCCVLAASVARRVSTSAR